jgi:hypothetical protein
MGSINNPDTLEMNKGVELLLRNRREKKNLETKQKKFGFSKKISLFTREIEINFFISLIEKR